MPVKSSRLSLRAAVIAALAFVARADMAAAQATLQPPGWDQAVRLPDTADLNPDPRIVEVNLEASVAPVDIGEDTRIAGAWTYNGGIPGPLIRARVGDRLIVHFSNKLPSPTTVHWHGLRVPVQMDGVPGYSQPDVEPGGSFTYDFVLPDAGLYWYHPHVMSAAQVGFGLYGALLVEDSSERTGVADELVLVLSDIAADESGALEPADSGGSAGMVFGREGNHVLVNGRKGSRLRMRAGAPQRWRIVNAAKSRYFQLFLDGQTFTKIGDDGGLLEYPVTTDRLVLAAGERADVIVTPDAAPGAELVLMSLLYNRGYGSVEFREQPQLLTVDIADMPAHVGAPLPEVRRSIEPLPTAGATPVTIDLTLEKGRDGNFAYGINGVPFASDRPLRAKLGETQIWTVNNRTKWSHPFHLHGFFFQVLDEKGAPVRPLAWKDTVDVPLEKTVRLAVRFDDRPGGWMYHCHILDHADGGLMGMVHVGDVPAIEHGHHEGSEPAR
jgi:FtsP/CotA-like multicopper oxidase with cupredoxin domain